MICNESISPLKETLIPGAPVKVGEPRITGDHPAKAAAWEGKGSGRGSLFDEGQTDKGVCCFGVYIVDGGERAWERGFEGPGFLLHASPALVTLLSICDSALEYPAVGRIPIPNNGSQNGG